MKILSRAYIKVFVFVIGLDPCNNIKTQYYNHR